MATSLRRRRDCLGYAIATLLSLPGRPKAAYQLVVLPLEQSSSNMSTTSNVTYATICMCILWIGHILPSLISLIFYPRSPFKGPPGLGPASVSYNRLLRPSGTHLFIIICDMF